MIMKHNTDYIIAVQIYMFMVLLGYTIKLNPITLLSSQILVNKLVRIIHNISKNDQALCLLQVGYFFAHLTCNCFIVSLLVTHL